MFVVRQLHYVKGHLLSICFVLWVMVSAARYCLLGYKKKTRESQVIISRKAALMLFKRFRF